MLQRLLLLAGSILLAVIPRVLGQTPPPVPTTFDVASVKPNDSGEWRRSIGPAPGGRFLATNQTLRDLMSFAYGVPQVAADIRILGGPSWIATAKFDVVAKTDATPTPQGMGVMLRTLLADRFALRAHSETRELPVYRLVMARNDNAFGARLRRSVVSESACAERRAAIGRRESVPPQDPAKPPVCGSGRVAPGKITTIGWSIAQLVSALPPFAGRVVLDRTGLEGLFDYDIDWTPDPLPRPAPDDSNPTPIDPNGPSLFTALQEQLGLKLESTKGPVDVVVIDHVERPTED